MASGLRWDDFDEALAAVRDVGPGGHYLGHPHTLANFDRAFFMSELFDNNSFEQWKADGSKDVGERAREYARRLLADYEAPPMDDGVRARLEEFVDRRQHEIPAFDGLNQTH
jgi:trimethylamine--corrinoid protein Co-methyltransferase